MLTGEGDLRHCAGMLVGLGGGDLYVAQYPTGRALHV